MNLIMDGWEATPVGDYAEASMLYTARRDESGLGALAFADGHIATPTGTRIARISYNGRVWAPGKWRPEDTPLWDNHDPNAHPRAFPEAPPRPAAPARTARPLSLEQSDRLSAMHHRILRARRAIRDLGIHLSHEDAGHIVAQALGQRTLNGLKGFVLRGIDLDWSHHAAAAAITTRLGIRAPDARRAADAAVLALVPHAATITTITDMLAAAPALAGTPIPLANVTKGERRAIGEAGIATIGDLVALAPGLSAAAMDAALAALTIERAPPRG